MTCLCCVLDKPIWNHVGRGKAGRAGRPLLRSRDEERGVRAAGGKGRVRGRLPGRLQDLTARRWDKQDRASFHESFVTPPRSLGDGAQAQVRVPASSRTLTHLGSSWGSPACPHSQESSREQLLFIFKTKKFQILLSFYKQLERTRKRTSVKLYF